MESRKLLVVAFHFPPFAGSSGVQRTLRFCQYLPKFGWLPTVLSAHPRAYEECSDDLLKTIPQEVGVTRAFALDSARHLAVRGRYIQVLALPDRWISWALGAIPIGYRLIRKKNLSLIWSTFPLATTHLIAYILHKLTARPWVADFRDPMVEQNPITGEWLPKNRLVRNLRLFIEKKAAMHATRLVFCTQGALQICIDRYPGANHQHWHIISNGFDEETFAEAEKQVGPTERKINYPITLVHSGVLYNSPDRDPRPFFEALSQLKHEGHINNQRLQIRLRACGNRETYSAIVRDKGIEGIVTFEPAIPYIDAIKEMLAIDGLLIFQGYTSNPAIPAKLYEYLRANRPIFALADVEGDTAKLLRQINLKHISPLTDVDTIKAQLLDFLDKIESESFQRLPEKMVMQFSREHTTGKLANLLDRI